MLYIFFFSINFEVWDPFNTGGNFSISKLVGYLYIMTILPQIRFFLSGKGYSSFMRPLWVFFGYITIISFLNINYFDYSFFSFSIFQNIILLILLVNHAKKVPGTLQKGFIAFALGSATVALLFTAGIGITHDLGRIRIFGDNENAIGIRMCISIIFLSFLIIQNPLELSNKRFLLLILIPFMFLLLIATGSRVAFISFSLCFLAGMVLIKTRRANSKILILGLGLIIGFFIINYVLSSSILYDRLINSVQERDLSDRNIIWKSLIPLIRDNPIFGVGTTGYSLYSYKVFGRVISPHNVLIEVLCYTGIIGLLIYVYFLFKILLLSWKKYRLNGNPIQLLLLIPVLGLILSGQLLTSKIGWILFAFAIGRTSKYRIV